MKRLCCHTVEWRQAYCFIQHMLEVSAVRLHACTKTLAPLVSCIDSDGRRYATIAANAVSVRQCRAPATGTLAVGQRSRSCNQPD